MPPRETKPAGPIVSWRRRSFVCRLGLLALSARIGIAGAAARQPVVVVTSYPDEVVTRFEAAFERRYPQWRLRVLWRMPHDALSTLRGAAAEAVDVYWTPSPRNFSVLKAEGLLSKLDLDQSGLPGKIGNTRIDDADGFFTATEVAGYGFAVNEEYLKRHRLPEPGDWSDLADPVFAGHVALPNPGRVGFAAVMADIPLQSYGWDRGWQLWSAIVANSALVDRGGTFVTDELASGRRGVAVSIDFFVTAAIARGIPLRFVYPRQGGINPGQVGILAGAGNKAGARDFATFVLGEEGQKLLAHPDIRKLPVRPAVYSGLPSGYHDPFAAAAAGGYAYNNERGLPRLAVVAALFETVLCNNQKRLARLWQRVAAADTEKSAAARQLLGKVPLSEAEADRADLQAVFTRRRDDAEPDPAARRIEERWAAEFAKNLDQAARLLGVS